VVQGVEERAHAGEVGRNDGGVRGFAAAADATGEGGLGAREGVGVGVEVGEHDGGVAAVVIAQAVEEGEHGPAAAGAEVDDAVGARGVHGLQHERRRGGGDPEGFIEIYGNTTGLSSQ
jgi:hypothetical protein